MQQEIQEIILKIGVDNGDAQARLSELGATLDKIQNDTNLELNQKFGEQLRAAAIAADEMRKKFGEGSKEFEAASQALVGIKVAAEQSFGSLKRQRTEAIKDQSLMIQLYGKESQEAQNAAKKVAELTDALGDMKDAQNGFDPDAKFKTLSIAARTGANAVQGVTGVMSAFGVESKTATETLAKLQGIMAFTQALKELDSLKNEWSSITGAVGKATAATQTQTVAQEGQTVATVASAGATRLLGAAFKALGIGLIISAIAALVENWDAVRDAMIKVFPFLGNMGKLLDQVKTVAFGMGNTLLKFVVGPIKAIIQAIQGDFSGALDSIKTMFTFSKNFAEGQQAGLDFVREGHRRDELKKETEHTDNQIKILQKRGKDTYALEKSNLEKKLSLAKQGSKDYEDIQQQIAELDAAHDKRQEDSAKAAADKRAAASKAAAEKAKAQLEKDIQELKKNQDTFDKIISEAEIKAQRSKLGEKDKELFDVNVDFNKQNEELRKAYDNSLNVYQEQLKRKAITQKQYNDLVAKLDKDSEAATIAIATDKGERELAISQKYSKIVNDFIEQNQQTAYQRQRAKLIDDFDEKIKIADEKQKVLLEKMKTEAVAKLDTQETLRQDVVRTETNLIDTQINNPEVADPKTNKDFQQNIDAKKALYQAEDELRLAQQAKELADFQGTADEKNKIEKQQKLDNININKQHTEEIKKLEKAKKDAALDNMSTVGNAMGALSNLIGQESVAGKALAIGQATIDTYVGANKALASAPPPFNYVAAAAVIATGLMNVKKIISTKVGKKDTAGSGAAGASLNAPSAADISQAPNINSTLLKDAIPVQDVRPTADKDAQIVKAYITSGDIQTDEQKRNFLNSLGTIK